MKKSIAIFFLALSILACSLGQSTTLSPTQTALASTVAAITDLATKAAWTATSPNLPTLDFTARIVDAGGNIYSGPNENYSKVTSLQGDVTIIGEAYGCEWLKVVSNSNSVDTGWISADKIRYSVNCSDVNAADFPPLQPTATTPPLNTPTATLKPSSAAPAPAAVNCQVNSNIIISNRSSDPITVYLRGPGNFTFTIGAGEYSTVNVCSGSYDYIVYGTCDGVAERGSGKISDGDQVFYACI